MSVVEVFPGCWLATFNHVACIGVSRADAVSACWKEAGLPQ